MLVWLSDCHCWMPWFRAWTALARTAAAPKPRMGFLYLPHGAIMEQWTPAADGTDFELPPILKPLDAFQEQLTIVSGLENKPAIAPPVHALNPGTWLSCVTPEPSQEPHGGVTIDQMAAQHIGQDTPLPSLEVATEGRGGSGACDRTYGCSYGATISFRTPTTPLPMEADPRKLFERLFGQGDTAAGTRRRSPSSTRASSIWCRRRRTICSARSMRRIAQGWLTISRASARSNGACRRWKRRISRASICRTCRSGTNFDQRLNLMFDMIALAYQANLTRVFSFMMAARVAT